jgi:hypothetical protein
MTSYYDVDAILAEEELVPCTSLFEFNYLSELDPDSATTGGGPKDTSTSNTATNNNNNHNNNYLAENSRIKIPLWVCKGWAMQGFVRLSLPRHYARKARERYDADPGDADLRYVSIVVVVCCCWIFRFLPSSLTTKYKKTLPPCLTKKLLTNRKRSERFFLAGQILVNLIERSSTHIAKEITSMPRWRSTNRMALHTKALQQVSEEALALRKTLLKLYAGSRLRKNFDWSQSSGGNDDDVSSYLIKLTEMEQRLYYTGSYAVSSLEEWKLIGNRRLMMGPTTLSNTRTPMNNQQPTTSGNKRSVVTPAATDGEPSTGQRRRLQ